VTALLIALLIGAAAGWLAGQLVQGTGFGLMGDILIGIAGAVMAALLFPLLGIGLALGGGILGATHRIADWRRCRLARNHRRHDRGGHFAPDRMGDPPSDGVAPGE
jgi:uncharacterized membrane protein YeaQ/YmgE (transglycosylase-associated protein family)